jgi:hypothetical protein
MCPACIASAASIAGSVVTTGGITALVAKIVGGKRGKTDLLNNTEGRNNHDNHDESE